MPKSAEKPIKLGLYKVRGKNKRLLIAIPVKAEADLKLMPKQELEAFLYKKKRAVLYQVI